jgi:hypothetical protein
MLLEEEWGDKKNQGVLLKCWKNVALERVREKEDGSYYKEDTSQIDALEKKRPKVNPFTEMIYRM